MIIEAKVRDYAPNKWHDVFIWFPLLLRDCETHKRYWVWLETVQYRRQHSNGYVYWQYYLPITRPKETDDG